MKWYHFKTEQESKNKHILVQASSYPNSGAMIMSQELDADYIFQEEYDSIQGLVDILDKEDSGKVLVLPFTSIECLINYLNPRLESLTPEQRAGLFAQLPYCSECGKEAQDKHSCGLCDDCYGTLTTDYRD
jgi:hypothetical protein